MAKRFKNRRKETLHEKLFKYLEESGVMQQWFAEQIGMNRTSFYQQMTHERYFATKYFPSLIKIWHLLTLGL